MIPIADFIKYKFHPQDTIYGFKEFIEAIQRQFRFGSNSVLYCDPPTRIYGFWKISNRLPGYSLTSGLATTNPDTRPFKAYLIHVATNGGTIHFVLNNMVRLPRNGYYNTRETGRTYRYKLITVSELKFIARYYDIFFKDHVNFYLFDQATNTLQSVLPLWKQAEYPEWQQYYLADSPQRAKRKAEFAEFIKKIPIKQPEKHYYGML